MEWRAEYILASIVRIVCRRNRSAWLERTEAEAGTHLDILVLGVVMAEPLLECVGA